MNKFLLLLALIPVSSWAQEPCYIVWPERPAEEEVHTYELYANNILVGTLTRDPVRMQSFGLNESEPHVLQVLAINRAGQAEMRSEPHQYTPVLGLPGQVGQPTTSGC